MTKKKKTLRAAVLASIFAMAFSATAWAATTYESNYKPDNNTTHLAGISKLDGWHNYSSTDFTDFKGTGFSLLNNMPNATWYNRYDYNKASYYITSTVPVTFDQIDLDNFKSYNIIDAETTLDQLNKDTSFAIKKFKVAGGYLYGTNLGSSTEPKWAFNFNPYSIDTTINGVVLPEARPDQKSWQPWDQMEFYAAIELATREVAQESEYRVQQDNLLHQDDIKDISHAITKDLETGHIILKTTLETFDNDTQTNKITSNDFDLTNVVNQVVDNRITNLEGGWTAKVNGEYVNQVTAGDTQNFKQGKNIVLSKDGESIKVSTSDKVDFTEVTIGSENNKITINNNGINMNNKSITNVNDFSANTVVANTSITTSMLVLKDGDNLTNVTYNSTTNRIVYGEDNNQQQVATLNDGMKYGADFGDVLNLTLNDKLNVNGDNNITTVATAATENTPAQIQVKLNDDITVNSVTANYVTVNEKLTAKNAEVTNDLVVGNNARVKNTLTVDKNVIVGQDLVVGNNANIGNNLIVDNDVLVKNNLSVNNVLTTKILKATDSVITPEVYLGEGKNLVTYGDDRIIYQDDSKETQQVANLNDYITYTADKVAGNSTNTSAEVKLRENLAIKGDKNLTTFVNPESKEVQVTLNDKLVGLEEVNSTIVNSTTVNTHDINVSNVVNVGDNVTINNNGLTIEGDTTKVVINETKVDVGGNKIENVAPGELSPDSQDAVNGSQLFNTNQKLDRLGNRVDKVGAGAAALAALHPLDFDPDDKLSFSAGVGNYGSETATALGAFYRPSEKVMLSAAGTMGNGENMVNLGVTFALDKTNNVSNSRVAMAREIQDLKSHIVKQDAQIAELIALVGQLTGKSIGQSEDSIMFPDVPENHWAYDYIEGLQKRGIVEGYPDGNFGGDRSMTRYEYAAMLYRALEKGFPVDSRLLDEFDAELGRIRIDRIKGLDDDDNKIERVRVNQYEDRDDYGSKLTAVNEAE